MGVGIPAGIGIGDRHPSRRLPGERECLIAIVAVEQREMVGIDMNSGEIPVARLASKTRRSSCHNADSK
jgi:hypothetical protein